MSSVSEPREVSSAFHDSFSHLRSQIIPSLNIEMQEYRHEKTGAMHYHLAAENQENVFLVAVRTAPKDSKGVAHVLEHTVLCGSEKYPVRDPYFSMTQRSLSTYMNAFTCSDWTAYPFASQNKNDYFNLLDVYLDAVFFARLDKLDFIQEGHRLEFEELDNPDSDLMRSGVVLNEMKGALNAPAALLWHELLSHLFPTTTYHHNSGGNPENIPSLTHDELLEFYRVHYHPSNAIFMTFGDLSVSEVQKTIEKNVLSRFEKLEKQISVADEKRYEQPIRVESKFPVEEYEAGQVHHVMGWLLGYSTDLQTLMEAHLVTKVLLGDSASPLRHALETTDLAYAPSPLCGLEDGNREMSFLCGVQGCEADKAEDFERLVLSVLEDVARNGVSLEALESVLHQLELGQRELEDDNYPYGLQLILSSLPAAMHRDDPINILDIDPMLAKLRESIQDPNYIKVLVKNHLLDNPHRVRLSFLPDDQMLQQKYAKEMQELAEIKVSMSDQEKCALIEQSESLTKRQQTCDDPEVLPRVFVKDISNDIKIPQRDITEVLPETPLSYYQEGTNGLVHQQIIFDMPFLEDELLEVLPYYASCLTELGLDQRDYLDVQGWQSSMSSGINASSNIRGWKDDVQNILGHFTFASKALARNHLELTDLIYKTLTTVRFDEFDRIRDIIIQKKAAAEEYVMNSGHVLAKRTAASGMSPAADISQRLGGLRGIQYLNRLGEQLSGADGDHLIEEMADKFRRIHERLIVSPKQFLLVGDGSERSQHEQDIRNVWQDLKSVSRKDFKPFDLAPVQTQVREIWTTNTQVNFCSVAYPTVAIEHPDSAPLHVLGEMVRHGYLHKVVREAGGAYGSGCSQDSNVGAFRMCSYRDPRVRDTLVDFMQATPWILDKKHNDEHLEESILAMISFMDKPISPAGEAKQTFHNILYGRTPEQRIDFRKRILSVTLDDLYRVSETYLTPEKACLAAITNDENAEQFANDGGFELLKL